MAELPGREKYVGEARRFESSGTRVTWKKTDKSRGKESYIELATWSAR